MEECPSFIVFLDADQLKSEIVRLPEQIVSTFGDKIPTDGLLKLPSVKDVSFCYQLNSGILSQVGELISDCKDKYGSSILFLYAGGGNFSVHIFDAMGTEIEYPIPRNPNFFVVEQDVVYGVGWKFFSKADDKTINHGVLDIPCSFNKRFRKYIPEVVLYSLPYGDFVRGSYCKSHSCFYGFHDFPYYIDLNLGDLIMLTNWESGQFDVAIFDKFGIEKFRSNEAFKNDPEVEDEEES